MTALIAYFSASGVTAGAAAKLAEAVGGVLYEIKPEVPYTAADLDWRDTQSRSTLEMKDPSCRPAMIKDAPDMTAFDTIYLGFPIWWYTAPRIVQTFLETHDFSGKRIVLFATSGGSGLGKTATDLKPSVSASAVITEGGIIRGNTTAEELKNW